MIYRIQGDKAIPWPRVWKRLETKWFDCGSRSSRCCYLQKDGKNLNFPPGSTLAGCRWEERRGLGWVGMRRGCSWVFALCLSLRWDEGGPQWGQRGLPHRPIRFPKSEQDPFWARRQAAS